MKIILIFVFAFVLTNTFGQTPINNTNEQVPEFNKALPKDTSVLVLVELDAHGIQYPKTAYFLNDQFIKYSVLLSLNPEHFKSCSYIYQPIEIDSVKYVQQVRYIAKNNYFPKAISLTNLKDKYCTGQLGNDKVIFIMDGKVVHGDYNTYEIDENNLYAITLDLRNKKEDKNKNQFILLTTKTEANIKNHNLFPRNIWAR